MITFLDSDMIKDVHIVVIGQHLGVLYSSCYNKDIENLTKINLYHGFIHKHYRFVHDMSGFTNENEKKLLFE